MTQQIESQPQVASVWDRIMSGTVDLMLTVIVAAITMYPFGYTVFQAGETGGARITDWGVLFGLGIVFFIFTLTEYFWGKTLGKWVMGLAVVDEATGKKITFKQSAVRNSLRYIDFIVVYIIGLIIILCTGRKKRQRIGDLIAKTLVVRVA